MSQATPPEKTNPSDNNNTEWRAAVQQSYRNKEVRQIAKVLASLEPGATEASKLRLAMQFEDTVFRSSTSLADYHKRLTKRLKKLQKNYKPVAEASSTQARERLVQELLATYGNDLRYVMKHAETAVAEMKTKYGEEKGKQLQQHIDGAKMWARDLGILPNTKPNLTMSDSHVEKLKAQLEKRLENLRSHTVKLAEPDTFLKENLQKIEDDFRDKGRAVRVQADNMRKRYEQLTRTASSGSTDVEIPPPDVMMTQALAQATRPVPLAAAAATTSIVPSSNNHSSRNSATDTRASSSSSARARSFTMDSRTRAALVHLDKMRAASTIVLAYLSASDKYTIPRNTLAKAHDVAMAGMEFVQGVMKEHRQQLAAQGSAKVKLTDAWMKPIVIPTTTTTATTTTPVTETADPVAKRQKRTPVLKSRLLLTKNRKTPPNLEAALKGKGVTLVRPPPTGAGSHLRLELEDCFSMTIYMEPLLVCLRAMPPAKPTNAVDELPGVASSTTSSTTTTPTILHHTTMTDPSVSLPVYQCATGIPLHHGLVRRGDADLLPVGGSVTGPYSTVGHAVEERLRDASAFATRTLRQCFAKPASSPKDDFEVELLEASALLEFVQAARDTFLGEK